MLLTLLVPEEGDDKHKNINSLEHSSQVWESASDTISSDSKWLQPKGNKENALNHTKQKKRWFFHETPTAAKDIWVCVCVVP